ncbi:hypothetical protein FRC02_005781 [Tulasnella sp. 418]|nr:hypothetical protein FRC02_005781 [Tulasnella sp. 418]
MAFSVSVVLFYIALGGYVVVITIQDTPLRVWDTWANVHSNWYRVAQFPRALYPAFYWSRLLMTWYIIPIGSILFFIFFGFGQEARVEYGKMILWFRTKVLRQTIRPSNESVLPTFSVPYRNESSGRVERVVKLEDDIDMMSIDEKWDSRQDDADNHSLAPSSSSSQTQVITPPPPAATQEDTGKPSQPRDSRPISIQLPPYSNDPASRTN